MIAPVVWNLGVWVRLGTPAFALGESIEMLATVIVSMGVAIGATKVDLDRVPTQIATPWCRSCCRC